MAAAFEVCNVLGHGFIGEIYQENLEEESARRSIPLVSQPERAVMYKGCPLRKKLGPDRVVFADIVVELKAVSALAPEPEAQILNDLEAAHKPVGYLVNSGHPMRLEWRRYARSLQNH